MLILYLPARPTQVNRIKRLTNTNFCSTRKIQAVDFGFSFGSPPPASQSALGGQTDQSAPEGTTNGIDSVVADAGLTNATSSVNNEGPTEKTPTRTTATASKPIVQSPLRSAANSNNRTSIFNSTLGEQEEGRSSKRRRISEWHVMFCYGYTFCTD